MEAAGILGPNGSVHASEPRGRARVTRFETGRVCRFEGCPTVLSFYNPAEHCWAHTEPLPNIALGRRPQELDGPRILSGREEQTLIRSLLVARQAGITSGRHPEPAPEPSPAPPAPPQPQPGPAPAPPQPLPQPVPMV